MVKIINKAFKYIFFLLIAGNVFLLFYKPPLPGHEELLPEITNEPVQENIEKENIELEAEGYQYTLKPRASYKIYGLVVSLYDSDSIIDVTHKNDPKNVRDLCVIWGNNAQSDGYKEVDYKSGEFTCFYRWRGEKPDFNPFHLSNNHIIPLSKDISNKVRDVNIGDQIYIEGQLVDYTVKEPGGVLAGKRITSTTRTDTGNGACEVIYVENIEILKRGNAWFYNIKHATRIGMWYVLLAWIGFNIIVAQIKKYKDEKINPA